MPGSESGGDSSGMPTGGRDETTGEASSTTDASSQESSSSGEEAQADCVALCAELSPDSCLALPGGSDCAEVCAETLDGESFAPAHAAFAECVATNPLCFETAEQCIWHALYPDPMAFDVEFEVSGPGLAGADAIYVAVTDESGTQLLSSAAVEGGVATAEFSGTFQMQGWYWIQFFADADGDGICDEGELGASETLTATGPFDAPRWTGAVVLGTELGFGVCDVF